MDQLKHEAPRDGITQKPRPGATRCPFCHEDCPVLDPDACACADCLSRHHRGCWEEARGCASCRSSRKLEATARVTGAKAEDAAPGEGTYSEAIEAWIRLGALYNALLVGLTAFVLGGRLLSLAIAVQVAVGAAIANVCFLLGPAIELVARRLGYRGEALRWFLFLPGVGIALILAFACCVWARLGG